jgi:hypothetical protein
LGAIARSEHTALMQISSRLRVRLLSRRRSSGRWPAALQENDEQLTSKLLTVVSQLTEIIVDHGR